MDILRDVFGFKQTAPGSIPAQPRVIRAVPTRVSQVVRREFRTLLDERGWERRGGSLFGYYRTPFGAYRGRIVLRVAGRTSFYIFNPPQCLWQHSHASCFIHRGGDSYEVHFSRQGQTVDDGLIAIEKILNEAHRMVA